MDCQDFAKCSPVSKADGDMHVEAETIAQQLRSPNVLSEREGLERLRSDVVFLPGAQVLELAAELRGSAEKRGLTNPLMVRPQVDEKMGYPRFTGNEFVVLTNPFDGRIDAVRATQEHSLPERKEKALYFNSHANAMVDHYAAVAQFENEKILHPERRD